ncbi:MAG: glycosyltransferase family protein [Caulobacterales bacterium]|nr:glycosyltransferase family protein [Caulobacterales bacterium]
MTFAVIVQARMGSSRLPGKVLQTIGAKSALAWCLDRCAAIPGVDFVVCAAPYGRENDPIEAEAARCGALVVRGPEDDVLARYALAAREVDARIVMRVTSDCPFIDPVLCGQVRDLLLETGADYACNNMPPLFPHGLDCDVFPARVLHDADWLATARHDREHVTSFLRADEHLKKAVLSGPGAGMERFRWTLDHAEDLALFRAVDEVMGAQAETASWSEIAAVMLRRPDLIAINDARVDRARLAAPTRADLAIPYLRAA